MITKPICKLVGTDGNVFAVIGKVSGTLREAGMDEEAKQFMEKARRSRSYQEVLSLVFEYVEVR